MIILRIDFIISQRVFCMRRVLILFFLLLIFISSGPNSPFADGTAHPYLPAPKEWTAFQEPKYGATLYYPSNWFGIGITKNGGYEFASLHNDGALLFLKTSFDQLRTGAPATVEKLKSGTGAHRIKDIQAGDMWYEMRLSPRPGMAQVTRVRFTCKERIVSAVTLIYPEAHAEAYEGMLRKLKRRFSVGIGTNTPVRDCS